MSSIMPSCKTKKHYDRIVVNVGGVRHETFLSTLKNIPDTRLYNLGEHHTTVAKSPEYDSSREEYFFDRHPGVFAHILNYYRTGRLHCPADVCGPFFEEELGFWGIDEQQVETCCWENYKQHKEKQEKLKYFKLPGFEEDLEDTCLSKDSGLFEDVDDAQSWWSRYQPRVWKSLEEPHTSLWAKFVGMISFLMFTAYLIKFSLTTLDYFNDRTAPRYIALSVTHLMCMSWFTMDFALRLVFSPEKSAFVKSPYTWTDLIPLVLLYVFFFYPSLKNIPFLEMLVMLKAARIFQLFKLSYVLQVLVNTLKASSSELCLLLGIMAFVMVVFASVLYFLERHEFESDFRNIPESMWWAVITMTTVGYGEVYPRTWIGKTVGSACAICGVLVIALPVSVVASNFSLFYTYAKARLNVPPKKRRVALSHALKAMHNTRTQEGEQQSLKFTSLCSERQTEKSLQASDISFSCSVTPRGSLKKSSFWSLRSFSKVLRPSKPSYASRSRSLNSILSEIKQNNKDKSVEGITLRLDPPTRAPSATEISPKEGSLPTGDSALLHVPGGKSNQNIKGSFREPHGTPLLNKSLYPLHLRRGAVSPASFSLKSNSTASSLNALPRGYNELCNALSGKGPIILLSDQASVQSFCSLQSLNPLMTCSCSSLRTTGTDGDAPSGNGDKLDSPTTKMEVTQTTLSVPKERHGMRKGGKESVTGTMKGNVCNTSLPDEKNLDEAGEIEERKEETVALMEQNREDMNTSDISNDVLTIREVADSTREGHSLAENERDLITSLENYLTETCANQFNLAASTANTAESCTDIENPAQDESSSHQLNGESTSFERNKSDAPTEDNSMTNTPVRPAPLVRKPSLCASPSPKSELGKGMLTVKAKHQDDSGSKPRSRTESLDMAKNNNSTGGGNSAFTPCRKESTSSLPRRSSGHFNTAFMKGTPGEREPLLNGHVAGACLPDIKTDTEKRLGRNGSHCVEPSSTHSATIENRNKHQSTDGILRGQSNHESSDNLQNIAVSNDFSFFNRKGLDQNSGKDRSNKDRTTRV